MKKKEKKLNFLSQEEIKEKIKNLHLSQRWEEWLDTSFSWYYFWDWYNEKKDWKIEHSISETIFKNLDLTWADFSNSEITNGLSFEWTNLTWADFRWAKFGARIDSSTVLKWADFRQAEYDIQRFSEKQKNQSIFTDKDYENFQKKLQEENRELKEITKNTSEEQTNRLVISFKELERTFLTEEIRWLSVSFVGFICLLFFLAIPILDIFMYQYTYKITFWAIIVIIWFIFTIATIAVAVNLPETENKNTFWKEIWLLTKRWWAILLYIFLVMVWLDSYVKTLSIPTESVFHVNKNYALIPFWFLLITFLYFSIYQYSKSKKLRIENQNKVALLHWFIALRTDTWTDFKKDFFYDNIANVVFDKVYQEKEANLPIDKIIDLMNILNRK